MDMKKWFLSKTLWFNVVTLAVSAAAWAAGAFGDNPDMVAIMVAIQSIGNIILRKLTHSSIA